MPSTPSSVGSMKGRVAAAILPYCFQARKIDGMALDKAIEHGQEWRRPYFGAKAVSPACRNHGDDEWAQDNRLHAARMRLDEIENKLEEWQKEELSCGNSF